MLWCVSGGFFLPLRGLERFCESDVYIGVLLDSYNLSDSSSRKGKFYEDSEINNVKWSGKVAITGLNCSLNKASEKKCKEIKRSLIDNK